MLGDLRRHRRERSLAWSSKSVIAQGINDLVGDVFDGVKGRVRGENSREERRLGQYLVFGDPMPDWKNEVLTGCHLPAEQGVQFGSGPLFGEEVRREYYDAKASVCDSFLDLRTDALP
jgi:hypothetical protein